MLKCLPSCLKKWKPTFDCKCSWCEIFIILCYKSRRDDSGFHETPHQTPDQIRSSPKMPSAPKQVFKREKSRESKLRKKSLKNEYNFWNTSIQKDESLNTEPLEAQVAAQAPPITVGPVAGYSSVYPHVATPTPVQPQLHYTPNFTTVTYTPAQQ